MKESGDQDDNPNQKNRQNAGRYTRDTPEFARVINLSDGIFAISMTLLVLTLDVPAVPDAELRQALIGQLPQFIAFALSFALVANIWWQHHKLIAMIESLDSVLITLNLTSLCAIAIVPFSTNLIGNAPASRVSVVFFIMPLLFISVVNLILVIRAQMTNAWRTPLTTENYYVTLSIWFMGILVMIVALIVAIWWFATGGLIILAVFIVLGPLLKTTLPHELLDSLNEE